MTNSPARLDIATTCAVADRSDTQPVQEDLDGVAVEPDRRPRRSACRATVPWWSSAPDVDEVVEAAAELLGDVADVGGEVGRLAVRADHDPVLVVAERPSSGTRARRPARTGGRRSRSCSIARSTQPSAWSEPSLFQTSKWTPSRSRLASMPARTRARRPVPEDRGPRRRRRPRRGPDVGRHRRREIADVGAVIAVLGDRLAPEGRHDRRAELVDLPARVVEVVLARDLLAAGLEDAAEQVADERAAGVADRQRTGRVGGDELDVDDPRARRGRPGPSDSGRGQDRRRSSRPGGRPTGAG